jgi:hypothetical protein
VGSVRGTRRIAWLLACVLVAGGLVAVGRWERERQVDKQVRGMADVRRLVGPLGRSLSGFRAVSDFECLVYRRGTNPLALELCVDRAGRVVEAIQRWHGNHIYTLRFEPMASTLRLDPAEVKRLFAKMRTLG